jgi:hypothetical protein
VRRGIGIPLGVVMVVFGTLFTFQGLGYVGGSAMTGSSFWAIAGPVIAGLGVAVLLVSVRRT